MTSGMGREKGVFDLLWKLGIPLLLGFITIISCYIADTSKPAAFELAGFVVRGVAFVFRVAQEHAGVDDGFTSLLQETKLSREKRSAERKRTGDRTGVGRKGTMNRAPTNGG